METREEAMAAATNDSSNSVNSECSHPVVKGKRTKRQRPVQSPAPASSASSSSDELFGNASEEDEDMANCLILLAQGRALDAMPKPEAPLQEGGGGEDGGGEPTERFTSRRFAEAATTTNVKAGFYLYECKTCNKCFPSFQALGGHRSSHKKPKIASVAAAVAEGKRANDEDANLQISIASNISPSVLPSNTTATTISAVTPNLRSSIPNSNNNNNNSSANNNRSRVHECSICGSEFSSGQALGGHMRRHRTAIAVEPGQQVKKEKSILSLDLNLPAPAEDEHGDYPKPPSFAFAGGQPLLFSSSALVDCHY